MANVFGQKFLRRALRPFLDAATHLQAQNVDQAFSLIDPELLARALRQGLEEEARFVGMQPIAVQRQLPWADVEAALSRLSDSRHEALEVWKMHRHQLGGFLPGVAEVTVGEEAVDVGWYFSRLAAKVVRDRKLSGPLDTLSADLTRWEQLVLHCGAILRESTALSSAHQRKMLLRVALGVGVGVALGLGVFVGLRSWMSHRRVDAVLAEADPCAVEKIAEVDLGRANGLQRTEIEKKRGLCEEGRARERRALEEKQAQEAYEARCAEMASDIEAGAETPRGIGEVNPRAKAALLVRIAKRSLEVEDFAVTAGDLPCGESKSGERILKVMAKAAGSSAVMWAKVVHVAPKLLSLLKTPEFALSDESRRTLSYRAEQQAKKAVFTGTPAQLADAKAVCDLERALGMDVGSFCKGVDNVLAKAKR